MLTIDRAERRYLKIRARLDQFDIRLRLRHPAARNQHGRCIGQCTLDQAVELRIAVRGPPTRGRPAIARQMDVVGETDLFGPDRVDRLAVVVNQRTAGESATD